MNAYELADELLRDNTQLTVTSAYMLRQQADRIADLETTLAFKKMKPLSDEEVNKLIVNKVTDYELCRAIEERHGIK